MSSINSIKAHKRAIITRYAKSCNFKGLFQVVNTLGPLAALWYAAALSVNYSYWITAGITLLMSLLLLRVFVLLHECGHGSLFRSAMPNRVCGFVFGVISGMPQYVWSQHHSYHHSTNGNWAKYRGPLNTASVDEYAAMSPEQQCAYERARQLWLAPMAGFVYMLLNPRRTWIKGTVALLAHVIRQKFAQPGLSFKAHATSFKTNYWSSAHEYWHMTWNNLALFMAWGLMCWWLGPVLFFSVYVVSVSLAGGAGIILFTVQHNFEHAYATGDTGWDYDAAAIQGTSFLDLPPWLNWVTANIAYHHIHHLSAKIPNYCLARCHEEYAHLFADVVRIKLSRIHSSLQYILWDNQALRIISSAEYRQRVSSIHS